MTPEWLPSLNALRAFESVARHLNYRLAAEELSVSPAAVKQLVAKLEESLDVPLFARRGRGLSLTAQGDAGRAELAEAFRLIALATENMRAQTRRKRLILSVEPSFAMAWLVPRLSRFQELHTDIDVLIDSSPAIVDLQRGDADIAIRFGHAPTGPVTSHLLFQEELRAFCSPRLALQGLDELGRCTLLQWNLTPLKDAPATRQWMRWENWLEQLGQSHIKPRESLFFSDYNLALHAAIAGQGVILGSAPILSDFVKRGLLVDPFQRFVTTDIGYHLVTSRGSGRSDIEHFKAWVVAEAHAGF